MNLISKNVNTMSSREIAELIEKRHDHKVTTVERSDGSSKVVEQVLVTPKGLTKLAQVVGGAA